MGPSPQTKISQAICMAMFHVKPRAFVSRETRLRLMFHVKHQTAAVRPEVRGRHVGHRTLERMSLRLSTVILPVRPWHEGGRDQWVRAERLGFHAAYTYDHLSWRTFRDGPWFGAVPTLTAAAAVTDRLRLGTLVTSPNFRHPVTLAKDLMSLDDISGGRITLGIGAGGNGFDATALGQAPWTPRERADRLAEFVPLLDRLLTEDGPAGVSYEGDFYSAHEARNKPGPGQRPRLPFALA